MVGSARKLRTAFAILLTMLLALVLTSCSSSGDDASGTRDLCSPPGIESASAAPTNLAQGATEAEDAATLLIRVQPELLQLPPEQLSWAPDGLVAYSKICTHVGCPVGLYRETTHELVCPCHQSTFAVLKGAEPVFGPATRALPQLPIGIGDDGYLVALSDFPEPVGPGFWNRGT